VEYLNRNKDCGLGSKASPPFRMNLLRYAYSHHPQLYKYLMQYKYMVKFGRTETEVSKPKRTCICTFDHRDVDCKQHGG